MYAPLAALLTAANQLVHPKLAGQSVDLTGLQEIVKADVKQRYTLIEEPGEAAEAATVWWIRANQGHSIKVRPDPILLTQSDVLAGREDRDEASDITVRYSNWCCDSRYNQRGMEVHKYI